MKVITTNSQSSYLPSNYYTGVGKRDTPLHILDIMTKLAEKLSPHYTLRSGGARGADKAFEKGALFANIYYAADATEKSMQLAASYHPAWNNCGEWARKLHGRNPFQVLGSDLSTPSQFLLCWTPDGATSHQERSRITGGTGTAISIASVNGVPVYNLQRYDHFMLATMWLAK